MFPRFILAFVLCFFSSVIQAASPAGTPSELMPLAEKSLLLDLTRIDGKIITVGERGHILISRDNGHSWDQVITPTRATLNSIIFADEQFGWAVGHSGIILDTNSGGETWSLVSIPNDDVTYMDAYFRDEWNGVLVGAYGEFATTSDAAVTLNKEWLNEEDMHYHAISRSPDGTLYIVGEAGQMFKSTNKGKSWAQLESPYNGSFFGLLCLDNETLIAFGLRGNIYRSLDTGKTWNKIPVDYPLMITAGIELTNGTILLSTVRDKIFISRDKGRTFAAVSLPEVNGSVSLIEASDGAIVFCGKAGVTRIEYDRILSLTESNKK